MTTPNPTDIFPVLVPGKGIEAAKLTWYDIRWQGSNYVFQVGGAQEKTLTLLGIHGYATEAEAKKHVQTMNALQAAAGGANILAGTTAGPAIIQPGTIAQGAGATAAAGETVGGFLARLESGALWLRIAEVALGLVLVAVGVAKIVPAFTPAGAIAKRVGVKL